MPKARVVYQNDHFLLRYGLEGDVFEHVPWYMREDVTFEDGGKVRGAYVQVRYTAGSGDVWFLPIEAVEKRRQRSKASSDGPWQTDYEAMVLKTAVRTFFPWLPVSIELRSMAVDADDRVTKIDPDLLDVTIEDVPAEVVAGELVHEYQPAPPSLPPPREGFSQETKRSSAAALFPE